MWINFCWPLPWLQRSVLKITRMVKLPSFFSLGTSHLTVQFCCKLYHELGKKIISGTQVSLAFAVKAIRTKVACCWSAVIGTVFPGSHSLHFTFRSFCYPAIPPSLLFYWTSQAPTSINPFAPGDFAEKRVLKLVEWFSGHCHAIKS